MTAAILASFTPQGRLQIQLTLVNGNVWLEAHDSNGLRYSESLEYIKKIVAKMTPKAEPPASK